MRIRYLTRHAPTPHAFSANPTGGPQRRLGATNLDSAEPRPWRKCRSFFLARSREQPVTPDAKRPRYVSTSASTFRSLKQEYQDQRTRPLWPQPVPEPRAREDGLLALVDRFVKVAIVAALVALLAIFGKPLLQRLAVLEQIQLRRQRKSPNHLTGLRRTTRRQIGRWFPLPRSQRPLPRRRLQRGRRSKRRSHRCKNSKRRSLRSRNSPAKRAASVVPFAG
jgi:heme exporter protein D